MTLRWALKWIGNDTHLMWDGVQPLLFRTRKEARDHAERSFGYIRHRADLHTAPHNWRVPKAVRVTVVVKELP